MVKGKQLSVRPESGNTKKGMDEFRLLSRDCSFPGLLVSIALLLVLIHPLPVSAQLNAGEDVTINPGVPVTLTANYGHTAQGVTTSDNHVEGPFEIGFPFTFYGQSYTRFSIGDNGWISFTHDINWGATRNIRLPSAAPTSPKNCILGAMEDYNPIQAGSPYIFYQTIGEQPNRRLVVMWCQCPMVGCMTDLVTFQIILKEGDTIETHIFRKPVCTNWDNRCTIGLQDETGYQCDTLPNMGRNSTSWSAEREGWRFVPASQNTYTVTQIPYAMYPITPGDKISFAWYEGTEFLSDQQSVVVAPTETTTYYAYCTLCSGETYSSTVTVLIEPDIPNAFTPNGDGLNDYFSIKGIPRENITLFNLQIFNRWGQLVFTAHDIDQSWNGLMLGTGEPCPGGVYTWVIYYEDQKKFKTGNSGSILLLR